MIHIILLGIEHPGNLGAIARVMKNFNQKNLILIDPKCSPKDQEAKNRAKHANDLLTKTKIQSIRSLKSYDYLIATTAATGTDYNLPRSPITPEQLTINLPKKGKIGILIGRESIGLSNEEIALADLTVKIPTSNQYPTLNIAHATAILLYELSKAHQTPIHQPASVKEKQVLNKEFSKILNKLEFATKEKKQTQRTVWKRLIGKSFLTKRESFALIGLLKKINQKIKK